MRTKEGITSTCEQLRTEQYYFDPMAANAQNSNGNTAGVVIQPLRTMIRSLDTLGSSSAQIGNTKNHHFKAGVTSLLEPNSDLVEGWAPEVEILSEQDLKKIEKQEDRESRMRKRRTR